MSTERVVLFLAALLLLAGQPADARESEAGCEGGRTFTAVNGLLKDRKYEEAAKRLDELRGCPHLSALDRFQLGWLYGRTRHFERALAVFNALPANVPDISTHSYAVALSEFELAHYQRAANALESARLSGSSDMRSATLLAVSYAKLGDFQRAHELLVQEIAKNPQEITVYLNLVTVCAEGGDFSQAAEVASKAAVLFPQSPEVLIVRGAANTLLGKLEEAAADFGAAVQIAPERADARFFLALTSFRRGTIAEATGILNEGFKLGLQDSDLHYLMAECLLKGEAGNSDAALAELGKAIELNGNSVAARTLRGRLLVDSGAAAQAVIDLEIANRSDPDSRSAIYNLGRAYRKLGRTAQAEALFRKLRADKPNILQEAGDQRLKTALSDERSH
jgi:tetratricopeptide (TPR) repeat protein